MPTISEFFGIIIYLYYFDNERHKTPLIHAKYQGQTASFSIVSGRLLAGDLPSAKKKLIRAWIEIHQDELMKDGNLASKGVAPFKIDPLR